MATPQKQSDSWQKTWDAREAALTSALGETDGTVLHSMVPFELGGQADVVSFKKHLAGRVAATCELLGAKDQVKNDLGTYELMIAHRDESDWGPNVISRLARYTCTARLDPGDTMDIAGAVPKKAAVRGFLFCDYARFKYRGRRAGLLLCLGITADELEACREGKADEVLEALKRAKVYTYTDLYRRSVLKVAKSGSKKAVRKKPNRGA